MKSLSDEAQAAFLKLANIFPGGENWFKYPDEKGRMAEQIVLEEYLIPNAAPGHEPKSFHISRAPDFKGTERELADHMIQVLKDFDKVSPEERKQDAIDEAYRLITLALTKLSRPVSDMTRTDYEALSKEYSSIISDVWGDLEQAQCFNLGNYVSTEVKNSVYEERKNLRLEKSRKKEDKDGPCQNVVGEEDMSYSVATRVVKKLQKGQTLRQIASAVGFGDDSKAVYRIGAKQGVFSVRSARNKTGKKTVR